MGLRVWDVLAPGGGGGGGAARRSPRRCGRGGQWGGESPCRGPSLCLSWAGNKAGVFGIALAMGGVASIPLGLVLACSPRARSVRRTCVLAPVCLSITVPAGAGGWGRGGRPCCSPPLGRRGPAGRRGGRLLCLGGGFGAGAPAASGSVGGIGGTGGGGHAVVPHLLPPGGLACGPLPSPPFIAGATPHGVRARPGLWGSTGRRVRPAAGGSAWRGGGGRPVSRPPRRSGRGSSGVGGPSVSVRPSAFTGRATKRASLAALRSWGAWPRYCSGSLSRAAPGRGPCVVLVRWRGFARLSRPTREQAVGGVGARGVPAQLHSPPGAAALSAGGGASCLPRGKWRAGAPVARRPEGGVGGRGKGGPHRGSSRRVALGPRPSPPSSPALPPLVYAFSRGCLAAPGTGRGLSGRRWVSLAGGGGGLPVRRTPGGLPGGLRGGGRGGLFAAVCSPAFRGRAPRRVALPFTLHSSMSPFHCGPQGALERRRRAAGRQWAQRE